MPENLADLRQRCSPAKHSGRKRVAEQMSALVPRLQSSTRQSAPDDPADCIRRAAKADVRSFALNENTLGRTMRTAFLQIFSNGLAHILKRRQTINART